MVKRLLIHLQALLPQHSFSRLMGKLAEARTPWLKDLLIRQFIRQYAVNMREALQEDPTAYACFNDFFTRQLKPELRLMASGENEVLSPADGSLAQIGHIEKNQLLQAKGFYFTIDALFANQTAWAAHFNDGEFATIYLAPHNYHRVHMPLAGNLIQTIYVPGKLFSVNRTTSTYVPNLYSRNERVITLFETSAGKMAVILVGAMIVGSMQLAWMDKPLRGPAPLIQTPDSPFALTKGAELGHFRLGSTVILLFQKNVIQWEPRWHSQDLIEYGQSLGKFHST